MTEVEKSAQVLNEVVIALMSTMPQESKTNNSISASIKFSSGEVKRMSPFFANELRRNGRMAHIIKSYEDGEIRYEIRYRRSGYNITVSDKDLIEAKRKFILSAI